jgi:hypothetical protein
MKHKQALTVIAAARRRMSAFGGKADGCPQGLKRDAMAAWRRFVAENEAVPLWKAALAGSCLYIGLGHKPGAAARYP